MITSSVLSTIALAETRMFVILKNGDIHKGEIVEQIFGEFVLIEDKNGIQTKIPFNKIKSITKNTPVNSNTKNNGSKLNTDSVKSNYGRTPSSINDMNRTPYSTDSESNSDYSYYFMVKGGIGFANSTNYKLIEGPFTGESDESDDMSLHAGFEFGQRPRNGFFGSSLSLTWNNYNYTSDTVESDTHLTLLGIPKLYFGGGQVKGWAGFGGGFNVIFLGTYESGSFVSDKDSIGFVISPRIGVDWDLGDGLIFTGQFHYSYSSNAFDQRYYRTTYKIECNRSIIGIEFGLSFPLN